MPSLYIVNHIVFANSLLLFVHLSIWFWALLKDTRVLHCSHLIWYDFVYCMHFGMERASAEITPLGFLIIFQLFDTGVKWYIAAIDNAASN